jgi:uncharacterized membrane protein YsdA (DUF1294 family)/cold shock CspA family protein
VQMTQDSGVLREGRLVHWQSAKGYGFIRPDDGGRDVFVHVNSMAGDGVPEIGSRWIFSAGQDAQGRGQRVMKAVPASGNTGSAAAAVRGTAGQSRRNAGSLRRDGGQKKIARDGVQRERPRQPRRRDQTLRPLPLDWRTGIVAAATLFCLAVATVRFGATGWLLAVYPLMSLVTYLMYARDKLSAIRGTWRVPESSLHLAELCGGWPGAYVAQQTMRHKTVKASYQFVYWSIVALHVGTAALWLVQPELVVDGIGSLLQALQG